MPEPARDPGSADWHGRTRRPPREAGATAQATKAFEPSAGAPGGNSGNWGTGLHDIFPRPDRGPTTGRLDTGRWCAEARKRSHGLPDGAVRRAFPDQGPRTRRHEVHSDKSRNAFFGTTAAAP